MKIVQISTCDIKGGAARAAYRMHKGLRQIGEDCRMLVRYKSSSDHSVQEIIPRNSEKTFTADFFLSRVIQNQYIDAHRTEISNTIFSLPYPGCDLSELPLVQDADIINLHWVACYQSPVTLHKLFALGKPVVWTLHDQWAFTGGCHYSAGCKKYMLGCSICPQLADDPFDLAAAILKDKIELFQNANLTIVTPSRWLASCAKESRLFRDVRVEVIPNSLETDVYSPISKPEAKEKRGFTADTTILLFGADFGDEKRKGFQELVAAIQYCMADSRFQGMVDDGSIKVTCFGRPGVELESPGVSIVSLGYLDSDDQIQTAYSAADIFILPSLEDNFPNTMIEALACGTPVIAFDVGGIPDVVMNNVTGKLVPARDIDAMGNAILSLVFDPDIREEMGHKGHEDMAKGFSLAIQAGRYLALYKDLLHRDSSRNHAVSMGRRT